MRTVTNPDATDDQSVEINNKRELEELIRETTKVSDALRQHLLATGLNSELYRQNLERLSAQNPTNPFRVDRMYGPGKTTFVFERGIYVLLMIEEDDRLRVLNLIGN